MAWMLEDGSHRGMPMLALGSGELVGMAADPPPDSIHGVLPPDVRLGAAVTGWLAMCSCGWRGPLWMRVPDPWDMDVERHLAWSEDDVPERGVLATMLHGEWTAHVQPRVALEALANRVAEQAAAVARVDVAVAEARAQGASWAAVAGAAGISRQSAHQRWSSR